MKQNTVDHAVEALCQKGCKALWTDIALMEDGEVLPELKGLDQDQQKRVLLEIKTIMAVYKGSCSL